MSNPALIFVPSASSRLPRALKLPYFPRTPCFRLILTTPPPPNPRILDNFIPKVSPMQAHFSPFQCPIP